MWLGRTPASGRGQPQRLAHLVQQCRRWARDSVGLLDRGVLCLEAPRIEETRLPEERTVDARRPVHLDHYREWHPAYEVASDAEGLFDLEQVDGRPGVLC